MSEFTYEFENKAERLEKYEWDNVWWEQTNVSDTPRVLYIGDSISCAARTAASAAAEGAVLFDGFGTSKAVDNPYFAESVRLFAMQQGERCAVFFNNGLHGWHLDDEGEYAEHYERFVQFLLKEFEGVPVFLLLTTGVADEKRNARVIERNKAVVKIAEKYGLAVIDLYSITDAHRDLISADGVHLLKEGYELLAKELVIQAKGAL